MPIANNVSLVLFVSLSLWACTDSSSTDESSGGRGGGANGGSAGTAVVSGGRAGSAGGSAGSAGGSAGSAGGSAGSAGSTAACIPLIEATIRDFTNKHADFETVQEKPCVPDMPCWEVDLMGVVKATLGADKKPELSASGPLVDKLGFRQVAGPTSFAQWFNDVPGVNMSKKYTFEGLAPSGPAKTYTLGSGPFFPIDGALLGNVDLVNPATSNEPDKLKDEAHNQLFTLEAHAEITYHAGANELMIVEADDDAWVFINGRLAIDNGGVHAATPVLVQLDKAAVTLGLESGKVYPIDIFYADRKLFGATLRIRSNMTFSKCL